MPPLDEAVHSARKVCPSTDRGAESTPSRTATSSGQDRADGCERVQRLFMISEVMAVGSPRVRSYRKPGAVRLGWNPHPRWVSAAEQTPARRKSLAAIVNARKAEHQKPATSGGWLAKYLLRLQPRRRDHRRRRLHSRCERIRESNTPGPSLRMMRDETRRGTCRYHSQPVATDGC